MTLYTLLEHLPEAVLISAGKEFHKLGTTIEKTLQVATDCTSNGLTKVSPVGKMVAEEKNLNYHYYHRAGWKKGSTAVFPQSVGWDLLGGSWLDVKWVTESW